MGSTVNEKPYGSDQPGLSGIPIGTFAIAAEVLRDYPGWPFTNQARFKRMLLDYFYPVCHDFLTRHNGANADYLLGELGHMQYAGDPRNRRLLRRPREV